MQASNEDACVTIEISLLPTGDVFGVLKIIGFMPRPQLPAYIANDSRYQFQQDNPLPIQNLGDLLTTTSYVDAATLQPR